ncbi:MAG: DUF1800 domain-containing protein [Granulosicoccus sp.]|nr:DUF1800 domain-containing protein [Granulosicoccus sp.]
MIRSAILFLFSLLTLSMVGCGNGNLGDLPAPLISQPPAAAPALPASEVANAAPDEPISAAEAYRLLDQTSFGANKQSIQQVSEIGAENWINEQMQLPATYLTTGLQQANVGRWNEYVNVWWRQAIKAEDQLRQRVAFALSQILVVSAQDGLAQQQMGLANYYDLLLRHAFGNYRELLWDISRNPVMGEYLSMKGNQKSDPENNIEPDENFARELLQLFSIGQVLLNNDATPKLDDQGVPLPAYDQNTIQEYARVFTGWQVANADNFQWPSEPDYLSPMEPWPEYHDTGSKQLLQNKQIAAGGTAQRDLNQALDSIFYHPNVGPFLAKQLIQKLVSSNPSNQYVSDVAAVFNRNLAGERGSLASTVKAILMHQEARYGHLENPDNFGKLKEPVLRVTQLWRAFEPEIIPYEFNYGWAYQDIGQAPLNSPSVFNFYRPDYGQPGEISDLGLVSPEFQIHDETSIISITNRLLANTLWSHNFQEQNNNRIAIDITAEMELESDQNALLDHLNILLLGGRMSDTLRNQAIQLMQERPNDHNGPLRITEAIFLIASSPEAAVQQ